MDTFVLVRGNPVIIFNFGVLVPYSPLFIRINRYYRCSILFLDQYKRHFRAFHERGNLDPESELVELITLRERAQKKKMTWDFFLAYPVTTLVIGVHLVRAAHMYKLFSSVRQISFI